jgi:predicted helicase
LKNKLYDPYVRFFRWATDRLEGRDGIVCFVSNNSFVDSGAFGGMRKHLSADFDAIHHVDLHGNVRQNPKLSGTTHNVFGIQVGVGITVAVRHRGRRKVSGSLKVSYARVPETWRKEEKLAWLAAQASCGHIVATQIQPDGDSTWIQAENADEFASFAPMADKAIKASPTYDGSAIFKTFSGGLKTNRDETIYDFDAQALKSRIEHFVEAYNAEVDRFKRAPKPTDVDAFVKTDFIKWDGSLKEHLTDHRSAEFDQSHVRGVLYRPFTAACLL